MTQLLARRARAHQPQHRVPHRKRRSIRRRGPSRSLSRRARARRRHFCALAAENDPAVRMLEIRERRDARARSPQRSSSAMTSELAVFAYLPGETTAVPVRPLLEIEEDGPEVVGSSFVYGTRCLQRTNRIEIDPVRPGFMRRQEISGVAALSAERAHAIWRNHATPAPGRVGPRRVIENRLGAPANGLPESQYLLQAGARIAPVRSTYVRDSTRGRGDRASWGPCSASSICCRRPMPSRRARPCQLDCTIFSRRERRSAACVPRPRSSMARAGIGSRNSRR